MSTGLPISVMGFDSLRYQDEKNMDISLMKSEELVEQQKLHKSSSSDKDEVVEVDTKEELEEEETDEDEDEEGKHDVVPSKNWILRPKKKEFNGNNNCDRGKDGERSSYVKVTANKPLPRLRPRAVKLPKFSASLTNEDIEEDFFLMTGAKPPKKPKKRPNVVQKQFDVLFPGLYLDVKPGSYHIPYRPLKQHKDVETLGAHRYKCKVDLVVHTFFNFLTKLLDTDSLQ